jgi:hypothetical protein
VKRVTGIGEIFVKANDAKVLAAWYDKHPGFFLEKIFM